MKNRIKIDFDGRWYKVYAWDLYNKTLFGKERGAWVLQNLYKTYEEARKSVEEMVKFPEYLP